MGSSEGPGSGLQGRGTGAQPANRFDRLHVDVEPDAEADAAADEDARDRTVPTEFFRDHSRSVISTNDSPDVPFAASLNPYRGCEHGCIYCYARPTHEFLGLSAGLDFETKIFVKEDAPELLRAALSAPSWEPKVLAMSGVTDCYQPIERTLRADAAVPRGAGRVPQSGRHRHQERAGHARRRRAGRPRLRSLRQRRAVGDDARRDAAPRARAAHVDGRSAPRRGGAPERGGRPGRRDGRAGDPRPERSRDPGDPRRAPRRPAPASPVTRCCGCPTR